MKIKKTHIVVELGHNGPDTMSTNVIVHELEDGNYFKLNSRGVLNPITRKEFMDMESNYYKLFNQEK